MDKEKADAPLRPDTRMLLHLAIRRVTVDPLGRAPHTGITGGRAGSHGWVRTRRCNRGRSQRGQRSKLSLTRRRGGGRGGARGGVGGEGGAWWGAIGGGGRWGATVET